MKPRAKISKEMAMAARPVHRPAFRTERKGEKLYVTLEFERPGWQQLLGADAICQRTFALDTYGQEIYGWCDGKASVNRIARRFAKSHHLSVAEAELSVTAFLKTLMAKGLVGMVMDD